MANFVKNDSGKKNNSRSYNKTSDYGSKTDSIVIPPEVCAGTIEYKMSRSMAEEIIKASKSNKSPQEVLCNYVNTQCGLKSYCIKVLVDLN